MSNLINLRDYGHLYFKLHDSEYAYYASLNYDYVDDGDGIVPSGLIHVYLLHPIKGSVVTQLIESDEPGLYVVDDDQPEIDSNILDEINQQLKKHIENIK
ncbi:hypothetical protein ABDK00_013965 [Niabella insulamsoli]|uniref:hypothetical protein n=1 Tax=Niabella insulamsoli TaxID=3144874 RepID=UPI0031FDA8A6